MMTLSSLNKCGLILLVLVLGLSLLGYTPLSEGEEDTLALPNSRQKNREGRETISRMFEIKNLDINEAKEKVQGLLTKDENIKASVEIVTVRRGDETVNFLVVKDTPVNIEQISQVLEKLEQEFAPLTVKMNFSDVPLNQILSTIAQSTDLNIIGGEALAQKVSVHLKDVPLADVFDIILKSSGYTYIKEGKVLRIVSRDELPLVTEVFELEFVSAGQIEDAASHLLTGKGNLKSFSKFSEEEYSNFLIVTDTSEAVETVRGLVEKLDQRVKQVMIEAKFCEVTLDKDKELGIEWAIAASLSGSSTQTMFPIHKAGLERLERPAEFDEPEGKITLGTISFTDFTTTLHALDSESEVKLIASPRVATRDGEGAEIVIGDKVPIPLYERNESTGTMEVTGYQTEEVGVLLQVTPIINKDNTVTLKIHPEVSEITGYTGPNNERPIVSTRQVTTVFTVEDGKTIVLGGLMQQTLSSSVERVPFLGKIPVLGKLFSYQDDSTDRTELLIFITPHVVESPEKIRQQAEAVMERLDPGYLDLSLEENK